MWGLGWLPFSGMFPKDTQDHNGASAQVDLAPAPHRPEQSSPFLRLPAELRIMIYDMALHDLFDEIITDYETTTMTIDALFAYKVRPLPPFVGAFALAHTSYKLRHESISAMRTLAEAESTAHEAAFAAKSRDAAKSNDRDLRDYLIHSHLDRDVRCILKLLVQLEFDHRCPRLYTPWSNLKHAQKLSVVENCYMDLSSDEQAQLDDEVEGDSADGSKALLQRRGEGAAGHVDKWETLVKALDKRVGRREREDYWLKHYVSS